MNSEDPNLGICGPKLEIPRASLLQGFKLIKKLAKPRKYEEAVLSFDGEKLLIDMAGTHIAINAQGYWPGQVRVSAIWLVGMSKVPPSGNALILRFADGHVHLQNSICPCAGQNTTVQLIQLNMFPDDATLLAQKLLWSSEHIEKSGLSAAIAEAEKVCMRRVSKAAQYLVDYKVSKEDIRYLIDRCLQERVKLKKLCRN